MVMDTQKAHTTVLGTAGSGGIAAGALMATPVSAISSTPHTGGGHTGQSVQTAPRSLAPPVPAAKSASAGHQQPLSFGFGGGNKDTSAGTRGGTRVTRGARGAASGQSSAFAQDDPPPPYRNRRPRTAGSTFGGGSNGACEDIARAWNVSIVWCRQHSMLRLYCTLSPFAFVSSMFNVQRSHFRPARTCVLIPPHPHCHFPPSTLLAM
jgi:hypothetical protein